MAVKRIYNRREQFLDSNGNPAVGAFLFFYAAGSSTKQNTFNSSSGGVANSNPIELNSRGEPGAEVWGTTGLTYKIVLAPSTDSDPPVSPIWTEDNISPVNDTSSTVDEWQASGLTPTFLTGTTFRVSGDHTTDIFQVGRALKTSITAGTGYHKITASSFGGGNTTVTVNGTSLDSGLTAVSYGLLSVINPSLPILKDSDFLLSDPSDQTRKARLDLGLVPTATEYAYAVPEFNGTVLIDTNAMIRRNLLINGNWLIDQINEGALYTSSSGALVFGPDGWGLDTNGAGVFKVRTLADPDNAAMKVLEITCTTADAAIGATDAYSIVTSVEGYDVADLKAGTASADYITIQFTSDLSVTGTYGMSIRNSATNRSYVGTFTQAVSNARETQRITLQLDTTGTWLYTNGAGLYLSICLAAGSTFQTTSGSWQAGNFLTTSAQANFMSSNTNIGYIGPIQVIPGRIALAFGPQDIQKTLARCQRYYEKSFNIGSAVGTAEFLGALQSTEPIAGWQECARLLVSKRAAGTVTGYSPSTGTSGKVYDVTGAADVSVSIDQIGTSGFRYFTTFAGADRVAAFHFGYSSRLT